MSSLKHYGVKGQKWRKKKNSALIEEERDRRYSEVQKKAIEQTKTLNAKQSDQVVQEIPKVDSKLLIQSLNLSKETDVTKMGRLLKKLEVDIKTSADENPENLSYLSQLYVDVNNRIDQVEREAKNVKHSELGELKHYGVLGMKWGVRKARPSGGKRTKARSILKKTQKKKADEYEKSRAIMKKSLSELTSEELKFATQRLRTEQEYRQVNPTLAARAAKVIGLKNITLADAIKSYNNIEKARDIIKDVKKNVKK